MHRPDLAARLGSTRRATLRYLFPLTLACAAALAAQPAAMAVEPAGSGDAYNPVTDARLTGAAKDNSWLMYRHDYGSTGYAQLDQINTGNVAQLKPAWDFQTGFKSGHEAPPVVNGNYMFITTPKDELLAFEASTGKQLWKYQHDLSKVGFKTICCDVVNRGVALYGDNVYMATLDNHVVALDAKTGSVVWNKSMGEPDLGEAMTAAPLIVKGMVVVGVAGGEYGARGYVAALNSKTGDIIWQQSTVPAPNEPGGKTWPKGAYKTGGGGTWLTGSYDVATNTILWGVGNPGPWLATMRPGDNLYTDSLIALNPATGKIKWHYQYTPHDTWDYDGVNEPVLTSIDYRGHTYKAVVSASRNGWFYAINRENGKLIYARPFAHATSVTGMSKSGTPITDVAMRPIIDKEVFTCPSFLGGKNWWPIAVDPQTHYAYVPTLHTCMSIKGATVSYKAGLPFLGETFKVQHDPDNPTIWGSVQAIDLNTGKRAWIFKSELPWNGGMLATAGGLVFSGSADGYLYGFDAKSGAVAWKSPKMSSGVLGVPSTWQVNGKQYVGVYAGWGGAVPIWGGDMAKDPKVRGIPQGGHLYVFAL